MNWAICLLLSQLLSGMVIDVDPQVDLPNDAGLPGPGDERGQHPTAYPEIPVLSQDRHPKLATVLNTRPLLCAKGQRPDDFALNFGRRRTDCRALCRISSSPLRGKLTFYDTEQVRKSDAESIRRRSGEHPCPPCAFPTRGTGPARAATAAAGL